MERGAVAYSYIGCGRSPAIPNQDLTSDSCGSLQYLLVCTEKKEGTRGTLPSLAGPFSWTLFYSTLLSPIWTVFHSDGVVRLCASVVTLVSLSNLAGVLTLVDYLVVRFQTLPLLEGPRTRTSLRPISIYTHICPRLFCHNLPRIEVMLKCMDKCVILSDLFKQ